MIFERALRNVSLIGSLKVDWVDRGMKAVSDNLLAHLNIWLGVLSSTWWRRIFQYFATNKQGLCLLISDICKHFYYCIGFR